MNPRRTVPSRRERGTILIMYAFLLMVILAFAGLVVDLGLVFFRRAQLQAAADNIALVAARSLNGTSGGVAAAIAAAGTTAQATRLGITGALAWNVGALSFSDNADAAPGAWVAAGAAAAAPDRLLFARVDMRALDDAAHLIQPMLMGVVGGGAPIDVAAEAVAGPLALGITPLAVCALSTQAANTRVNLAPSGGGTLNELVTYGFRHGVTYNLLMLNPQQGATQGAYFLVDPVAVPGTDVSDAMTDDTTANAFVGPAMCAGQLAYTAWNGRLHVRRPAAFGLAQHLNSRFNTYNPSPVCVRTAAPPDTNIKSYAGTNANWQTVAPAPSTAASVSGAGLPLATIADQAPVAGVTYDGKTFGIRWAFGPARAPDGSALTTAAWPTLYPSTTPVAVSGTGWPAAGPYRQAGATFGLVPGANLYGPARTERRLLRIPLLDCQAMPGTVSDATVLAIGRFFLSAPATATEVAGEFAGVETAAGLSALKMNVEVLR